MRNGRLSKHQLELIGIVVLVAAGITVLSAYIVLSGSASTIEAFGAISGFLGGSAVAYLATCSARWTKNGVTFLVLLSVLTGEIIYLNDL